MMSLAKTNFPKVSKSISSNGVLSWPLKAGKLLCYKAELKGRKKSFFFLFPIKEKGLFNGVNIYITLCTWVASELWLDYISTPVSKGKTTD